jgi:hypothetical protein
VSSTIIKIKQYITYVKLGGCHPAKEEEEKMSSRPALENLR